MSATFFEHARRLQRQNPGGPLPRDGEPYPDAGRYRPRAALRRERGQRRRGAEAAGILDRHFSRPEAPASDLADAFRDVHVPLRRNDHIAAAALRAPRKRVRRTARWLVRHGTDRNAVAVGLALLATDRAEGDIPLIRTIGLLSNHFGPLAAEALQHRPGGTEALVWLADRVAGWGRVHVVEALCRQGATASRAWLLRHACDGDLLNGYFAGKVATAAHLSEAITGTDPDDDLVDHTGRLLRIMAGCEGMGMTLQTYPPAATVLAAHAAHLARQSPGVRRYVDAAMIADHLTTTGRWEHIARAYLAVLDRPDWRSVMSDGGGVDSDFFAWFTTNVATRLSQAVPVAERSRWIAEAASAATAVGS